jgi:hypothetical protein
MSLAHIRFIQSKYDDTEVRYIIESSDFTHSGKWVAVGTLCFDKQQRQYEFAPSETWSENKVPLPSLFGLPEAQRERLIDQKSYDWTWELWAKIVHEYATHFLSTGQYPSQYPTVFFPKPK